MIRDAFAGFQHILSRSIRAAGQGLETAGRKLEVNPNIDKLSPSLRSVKLKGHAPQLAGNFVAPSAAVIGQVKLGKGSSIWYGAVLRGDDNTITIGEDVTIGDRVMIHCSKLPKPAPAVVGDRAVIGSGAILHGCQIAAGAVVGEGSQVLDNAKVGEQAMLAPGSFLGVNKSIPPRQLWAGVPAIYLRDLTTAELEQLQAVVEENKVLAVQHAQENAKSWQTIEWEEFEYGQIVGRNPEYYRRLTPEEMSKRLGEVEGHTVPGRIFDSPISAHLSAQKLEGK